MALVKSKTLPSGATGEYWRIVQRNSNFDRQDDVVTLQLYVSQQTRLQNLQPLPESVQFNFIPGDHPMSDFNPSRVDTDQVDDLRDLEIHARYLHIKDVAQAAHGKPEDEQTANEQLALWFLDAEDVY